MRVVECEHAPDAGPRCPAVVAVARELTDEQALVMAAARGWATSEGAWCPSHRPARTAVVFRAPESAPESGEAGAA